MKFVSYRLLAMGAFIILIGLLGILARHYGSMDWLIENEARVRQWVEQNSVQAWFVGLTIYAAFSLVPGTAGKSVVFGWLFGFWKAVLMIDLGLTFAAIVSFVAARFFIADAVHSKFGGLIGRLNRGLEKDGGFYLLMMRLAHMPFSVVNYGAGATSVSLRTFAWTTMAGLLPGTMIMVFVGTRIPTLSDIANKGAWELLDPMLYAILVAAIVFPSLIHWAIRYFSRDTPERSGIEIDQIDTLHSRSAEEPANGVR